MARKTDKNKSRRIAQFYHSQPVIDDIRSIMSHYRCPESCHAFCCKREEIEIDEMDLQNIKVRHPIEAGKIPIKSTTPTNTYTLSNPCQFLRGDNCNIQAFKPVTCMMYPFSVGIEPEGFVGLHPCLLGKQIAGDLHSASKVHNRNVPGVTPEMLQEVGKIGYDLMTYWRKQMHDFYEERPTKSLRVSYEQLSALRGYLENRAGTQ